MRSRCGLAADAPKRRIGAPRRRYGRGPGYRRGVRRNGQIRLENNSALPRLCPTVVELSNQTQFLILIVILLLIFKPREITIMIKIKIKRRKVAKHSLNSMEARLCPGRCDFVRGFGTRSVTGSAGFGFKQWQRSYR